MTPENTWAHTGNPASCNLGLGPLTVCPSFLICKVDAEMPYSQPFKRCHASGGKLASAVNPYIPFESEGPLPDVRLWTLSGSSYSFGVT